MSLLSSIDGAIAAAGRLAYAQLVMSTKPVAWWPLDANLLDRIGTHNGIIGGGSEVHSTALPTSSGGSFDCAGTNWISVAHDAALKPAAGSIMIWFKPATIHQAAVFSADVGGLTLGDFQLFVRDTGQIRAHFQDVSKEHHAITASSYYFAGQIVQAVVTFDGIGFSLYFDGNLIDKNTSYTNGLSGNANDWNFGRSQTEDDVFDGVIDEIALWDRVLTRKEIYLLAQIEAPS